MSGGRCSRLWEVEAARDGRLPGDALAAHAEHLVHCNECERERKALDQLGQSLRANLTGADEVSLRRMRRTVLQRADEALRAPAGRARWLRGWPLAARAAGALVLAVSALWPAPVVAPRHATTVTSSMGARWRRVPDGALERLELTEGEFELMVERRADDRRVLVSVPDGEIEDLGTAFAVAVRSGRTLELAVHAGSVVFHRSGAPDARVSAGERWRAEPAPQPERALPPGTAGASAAPPTIATIEPRPAKPRATTKERARTSYREDASYLRIISLLRDGRIKEARAAALAYRNEFPAGFRRAEVERILDRTAGAP